MGPLGSKIRDAWADVFYGNQNTEDIIINQFVGALSTSDKLMLDPYTYLIKNESGGVQLQTGKLGITTTFHYNYPVIKEVAKGSAADGILKVGDIITTTGRRNGKGWDYYSILDNGYDYSNLISSAIGLPGDDIYIEVARIDKDNKGIKYEFDKTDGDVYKSVQETGKFTILDLPEVTAHISDNGKFMLIYTDKTIDEAKTEADNYKKRQTVIDDFKAFNK